MKVDWTMNSHWITHTFVLEWLGEFVLFNPANLNPNSLNLPLAARRPLCILRHCVTWLCHIQEPTLGMATLRRKKNHIAVDSARYPPHTTDPGCTHSTWQFYDCSFEWTIDPVQNINISSNQTNSIVKKSKLRLQPRFRTLGGTGVERQISILWVAYNSANTNRGIPFLRQTISLGRHLFFVLRSEFFVVLTNVNGLLFHWTILLPTQQTF